MEKESERILEETRRFLEEQGVNVEELERERKAMMEKLASLDRRVHSSRSQITIGALIRGEYQKGNS